MGMPNDGKGSVGIPNAKTRTKHAVKLTKEQYAQLLARVLNESQEPESSNLMAPSHEPGDISIESLLAGQGPNPLANLPQRGMGGMGGGMRMSLPGMMPSPPMPGPPPVEDGQSARLQALMQQLQGMQPMAAPKPQGMMSLQEILAGRR